MALTLVEMTTAEFVHLGKHQKQLASKLVGEAIQDDRGVFLEVSLEYRTFVMAFVAIAHAALGRFVMSILERAILAHGERPLRDSMSIQDSILSGEGPEMSVLEGVAQQ